jgi:hypothetical protein
MYRGPKRGLNRFVADLEKQFDDVGVDGATATVGQLLDRWLTQHPEWAPYTLRDYSYRAAAIKADRLGSVRLVRLGVKGVEDWIARMRTSGVGEGAIRGRVVALRAALTDAQRWEWVGRNVASIISPSGSPPSAGPDRQSWRPCAGTIGTARSCASTARSRRSTAPVWIGSRSL